NHAVTVRDLHNAGVVAFNLGLVDHIAPPADHRIGDADHAHAEHQWRINDDPVHPQDQPDGGDEGGCSAYCRPRTRIDQMVVVVRFCVNSNVGHRHHLHFGTASTLEYRYLIACTGRM